MMRARVIRHGERQEISLPEECRFDTDEVWVEKIGDAVMLFPKDCGWRNLLEAADMLSDDCFAERLADDATYQSAKS